MFALSVSEFIWGKMCLFVFLRGLGSHMALLILSGVEHPHVHQPCPVVLLLLQNPPSLLDWNFYLILKRMSENLINKYKIK